MSGRGGRDVYEAEHEVGSALDDAASGPGRQNYSMADASTIGGTLNDADDDQGPERLFSILEGAVPRPEDALLTTPEEVQRRREIVDMAWELSRRWLRAHESREERAAAACVRGQVDATPLHLMCKLSNPPVDIIGDILEAAPEVAGWTDGHGWLPLHHACANGVSSEVLILLTNAFPQSKIAQDNQNRTPLHFYAITNLDNPATMAENVKLLTDSGAAQLSDRGGMLPMHYACAYGANTHVLKGLAEAYPESLVALENNLRTPMHLAMVNAHRDASPGVVKFLLDRQGKQTVNMRDHEGGLPLHLLARHAKGLSSENQERLNNVSECLTMYLAAEPFASPDFLTALQDLPEWLQESAVVSQHVRSILNKKIVQRFPTSILMLDGYWLMIIIVCFEITTTSHIDIRISDSTSLTDPRTDGALVTLFFGASYFLLRELIQIISLWSLGSISSWFFDANNWLDMAVITLVFYYSILMTGYEGLGDEQFRSGVAFTKGVLWMAVIYFLKSTLVDFAVFVGGVFYVVQRLVAFLMAVGVILLAFSQMFYIEYRQRDICNPESVELSDEGKLISLFDPEFPHCSFDQSLLKVYTMMMGEIGDESRYNTVLVAQFLYVGYAFLVVILLSNVLIAIVTDSYEVVQNERAAVVFWTNRLDFVAEIQAIKSVVRSRLTFCGAKAEKDGVMDAPTNVQESPTRSTSLNPSDDPVKSEESDSFMREAWKGIMVLFESNFFDDIGLHPSNVEFWFYLCYQGVAILIIIPGWIALGLLTAGILWPPQVREYLFVQKETAITRAELERQKLDQLREIQTAIKSLKSDIRKEMSVDREDMLRMRTEVETIQSEVLSDLLQVKELMTTLLDMGGGINNG